jgi:uncharacterized protein (DUF1786 family)
MFKTTDYPREIQRARSLTEVVAITQGTAEPAVDSKIAAIVGAPPERSQPRKPLFIGNGGFPLGVVQSFLERKTAYWGRYE